MMPLMERVRVGLAGVGTVGSGAWKILRENAGEIRERLGFYLTVTHLSSRSIADKVLEGADGQVRRSADWRELVADPEVDLVAELMGGTTTAREVLEAAIRAGKPVVTANKELLAQAGAELVELAASHRVGFGMEASVAGGIPVHTVLREGICGDELEGLHGILNGTSNFILTRIEREGAAFGEVLAEAQRLGYAEADPTADIEGFDARSKLAILAGMAFGVRVEPEQIAREGITRIGPVDFEYARQLGATLRLLCSARRESAGLRMSVRPALVPQSNILASVQGSYNAIYLQGRHGQDTFYYGRGAGSEPTGVAVVSDLMRLARDLRSGRTAVPPFGYPHLRPASVLPAAESVAPRYLRFRVRDQVGIISSLASILAECGISVDAVLQVPGKKDDLPFVITVEPCSEASLGQALASMAELPFLVEPPLALPIERFGG